MKKDLSYIIIATLIYSYLFFQQSAGVNFLIFSGVLIACQAIRNPDVFKSKSWILAAVAAIASGIGTLIYGNTLSVTANIISVLTLAFTAYSAKTSLTIGLFHSVYSVAGAVVFMIIDFFEPNSRPEAPKEGKKAGAKLLFYLFIPLTVLLVFFGLYRSGNNVFQSITDRIDLSFISLDLILFVIMGSILMFGFFRHRVIKPIQIFDENAPNNLVKPTTTFIDKLLNVDIERKSGIVMFISLNLLLLIVNIGDGLFISGNAELPEGMSLSDSVHHGIGSLIASIVFAVLIILFYFRGRLNFVSNNKQLRALAMFWIAQNLLLVGATSYRNWLYVESHGLTYKRIGVYIYLGLTIIGLLFTIIKVLNVKTNWFLVRAVSWSFFIALFTSPLIDWDQMVIDSQLKVAEKEEKVLDLDYLVKISPSAFPVIMKEMAEEDHFIRERLNRRIGAYLYKTQNNDWRSFSLRNDSLSEFISNHYSKEQQVQMAQQAQHWWL